jgi:transposase
MRGASDPKGVMFFAIDVEGLIRPDHPLRPIKRMMDQELAKMDALFDKAYSDTGRPSVPPEMLLKALLLQALYSVRSERALVERIATDLLFRWFVDMDPAQDVFDHSSFTHNRVRLSEHGLIGAFFDGVVKRAMDAGLCSDDHFSVDGTLIQSHASLKGLRPIETVKVERDAAKDKDGNDKNSSGGRNPSVNFRGQKRSNQTHQSPVDPEARLCRKGDDADRRRTMRQRMKTIGYAISQRKRKLVEEAFGWIKTVAGLRRTKLVGRWKLRMQMQVSAAAYNLVRMRNLAAA